MAQARPELPYRYVIAIGSNQPRSHSLTPKALVDRALNRLAHPPFTLIARSAITETTPVGPSRRRYANAAAAVTCTLPPDALLCLLKLMERAAGRRNGQRWAARPLDLDIILWSGGRWEDRSLTIPHLAFSARTFVLHPLREIVPTWRDPVTNIAVRNLFSRLKKPKPVDRSPSPH